MIKKAKINDIIEIVTLEKECFDDPWTLQSFEEVIYSNFSQIFCYVFEGKIVGYACITTIIDEIHLGNIAVKKEYRGQGIGRKLIDYIINYANQNKIQKITLEVRRSNTIAINLYKSVGFVTEGVRKKYYMNNEDALIMWRYEDGAKP